MEKAPCHILPSCILWHLHLPSPGSSTVKFELSIPPDRKEWEALGLRLSRATMSNWLLVVYRGLACTHRPPSEAGTSETEILTIDETHVQVLERTGTEKIRPIPIWSLLRIRDAVTPSATEYQPTKREISGAASEEYEGYIHTDALPGYNAVSGVKRCLCYTHLRWLSDALPKRHP